MALDRVYSLFLQAGIHENIDNKVKFDWVLLSFVTWVLIIGIDNAMRI